MHPHRHSSLKELQEMDLEMASIESIVSTFEEKLEEVEEPVQHLEKEVSALEARLKEVTLEENRLELSIEERRVRSSKLQERMNMVRNVREEAAVHAEMEMVSRALENDEQEALSLLDQIRRMEERMGEHEAAYQEALAEVEPRRRELLDEKEEAEARLQKVRAKRDKFASTVDPVERRVYESIMAGARDVAVAELTHDGACGNCFSVIPLQLQNEVRQSVEMIRCEACGVILTPASAEGIAKAEEEAARIGEALRASEEAREAERAARAAQEAADKATEEEARLLAELVEAETQAQAEETPTAPETEEVQAPEDEASEVDEPEEVEAVVEAGAEEGEEVRAEPAADARPDALEGESESLAEPEESEEAPLEGTADR